MQLLTDIQSNILVLLIGYALSLLIGISLRFYFGLPLRRWAHRRVRLLGERLNQRSVATRVWRGLVVVIALLVPAWISGWMTGSGFFAVILIALSADIQPCLWHGWAAVRAAKHQDTARLELATTKLALEPQTAPDRHGQLRLIIMSLIQQFAVTLVGGAFWFALLGAPAMLAYYALATAARYFHTTQEEWRAFGWAATGLFSVVDAFPSLIAGALLLSTSLLVPKAKPMAGLKAYLSARTDHHAHAIAATLNISLGGPSMKDGTTTQTPWIGQGTAQLEGDDLARFMTLFSVALLEFVTLLLFINTL